ncbi:PorV/PorQ family protein [Echinicola jeungdonensis]|uniref:PorV/PorQ family protein n=1 Tax=Echinicola jeungdonensis TaxID=709343 RepID=A0ABV5J1A1_9BACT|nr:PorV/PorQ family protein [Echinicola jeungdonensis]MDN3668439.1 PorV/PorQ family protein [Echinicola jeungdonensis]
MVAWQIPAQTITPKYSNEFMNIGVGARALGMGGAQVAAVHDVTAAYWNPAGILGVQHEYEFSLMHAEYFAGIAKFDYAGFTTNIQEDNQIALSLIRFGVDDIPDTRFLYDANGALNYDNIQFFNAADYAFLLSFARDFSDEFKLGFNTKVIHRNVGKFAKSWGLGFDLGGIYLQEDWQFGLMLRDITTTFNAWFHNAEMVREVYAKTNNEVPVNSLELTLPRAIFSVSRHFDAGEYFVFQAVMDLDMTFDGKRNALLKTELASLDPRIGVEASYKDMAFLRGGIKNFQYIKDFDGSTPLGYQPTFGLGVLLSEKAYIDYALTDIGSVSETPYTHVFSLKVSFNPLGEGFRLFDGWED